MNVLRDECVDQVQDLLFHRRNELIGNGQTYEWDEWMKERMNG